MIFAQPVPSRRETARGLVIAALQEEMAQHLLRKGSGVAKAEQNLLRQERRLASGTGDCGR
jgi:hypothetical protein